MDDPHALTQLLFEEGSPSTTRTPHHDPLSHPQKPRDAPAATPSVRPVAHRVRAASRNQFLEETLGVSLMPSVSAPTHTGTLDNFVWWHRLRHHRSSGSTTSIGTAGPTAFCSSPSTAGHATWSGTGRSCRHVVREGFRTRTGQGLSLLPLPIGLPEHGDPQTTTTETLRGFEPAACTFVACRASVAPQRLSRCPTAPALRTTHARNSSRPCRIAASVSRNSGIALSCNIFRWAERARHRLLGTQLLSRRDHLDDHANHRVALMPSLARDGLDAVAGHREHVG